jgi:pyruvate dehydrogenase E2 component (dihydrolipoamide acetyltransferase)
VIPVVLPQLSISMEEGKLLRWLVDDGADVAEGQPVLEVETDKATMEVEAPVAGRLRRVIDEGAVVPVETTLAEILDGAGPETAELSPPPTEEPAMVPPAAPAGAAGATPAPVPAVSPAARRLARERGIDLASVRGSGPGGRIVAADLEAAAPAAPSARGGLRSAVLANITASWREIPHIHIAGELDARGLVDARAAVRAGPDGRVTVTDLLVLAVARALVAVPAVNGGSDRVHLALAVATDETVVAPVLRDAGRLGLAEIARERARVVTAAREGRSDGRDLAGATCTLSNLGAYPVDFFAPVVSGPQAALIATGRVADRPVAVDGMLTVRPRLWVNVALDHRRADGEAGGRFLAALERELATLPATIEGAS